MSWETKVLKQLKSRRVVVLMGGDSAERIISLRSGQAVMKALKVLQVPAQALDVKRPEEVVRGLTQFKAQAVFLALHGSWGENGTVQGLLEMMQIPYTGSGVLASALAMHKEMAKRVFASFGISTPPSWTLKCPHLFPSAPSQLPVVVKPIGQGSAIGVSLVWKRAQWPGALRKALRYDSSVLVEKYIHGREVSVGVLGDTSLPPVEILPKGEFYDYHSKYDPGGSVHRIPPQLSVRAIKRVQDLAFSAFKALGCRAVGRVDCRVTQSGKPYILEVNTLPGLTPTSLLPEEAQAAGLSFEQLILRILAYSLLVKTP